MGDSWIGTKQELFDYLTSVEADKDEATGHFLLAGNIIQGMNPTEIVVTETARYRKGGDGGADHCLADELIAIKVGVGVKCF